MKKAKLLALFLLQGIYFSAQAQTYTGKEFVLNNNLSGTTKTYIARDQVKLTPGFKYTPQSGKSFRAYIDESIIVPTDYVDLSGFYNQPINTSLPVGAITGQASVNDMGGAMYTIPFDIPKGTNGMKPSIGVAYNSFAGDGIMGMGWNILGISAITRIPHTKHYDDINTSGVSLTYADRFALDGQRLVVASYGVDYDPGAVGAYGKNGTVYHTNPQSFSKITSIGQSGNGPERFKVETKQGLIMEYGSANNARLYPKGSGTVLTWYLTKITDGNGNYVEFKYKKLDGECVLEEILYTGNTTAGFQPYNSVRFFYDERYDKGRFFVSGNELRRTVILREVKITAEDNYSKSYEFKYAKIDNKTCLVEIKEKAYDNSELNSTKFNYKKSSQFTSVFTIPESQVDNSTNDFVVGDYNGDGVSDILALNYFYNQGVKNYTVWKLYIKETSGYKEKSSGNLPTYVSLDKKYYYSNILYTSSDIDGDGADDFSLTYYNPSNGLTYMTHYRWTGSTFQGFATTTNGSSQGNSANTPFIFASLKGDGTNQVLWVGGVNNPVQVYDYERGYESVIWKSGFSSKSGDKYFPVDVDGDGITELMVIRVNISSLANISSDVLIFKIERNNELKYELTRIHSGNYPLNFYGAELGDFNGDGITDIVTPGSENNWNIYLYKGGSQGFLSEYVLPNRPSDINVYVADINSDGKSEFIYVKSTSGTTIVSAVEFLSFIGGLTYYTHTADYSKLGHGDISNLPFGDFLGTGNLGFLHKGIVDYGVDIYSFFPEGKQHLVSEISNGFNNKQTFAYQSLSRGISIYEKENPRTKYNTSYLVEFHRPIYVVTSTATRMNSTHSSSISLSYKYKGAVFNNTSKNFLGFSEVIVSNSETGLKEEKTFKLVNTLLESVIEKSATYTLAGVKLSETDYGYGIYYDTQERFKRATNVLKSVQSKSFTSNSTSNTTYDYGDDFGNITKITNSYSNGEGSVTSIQYKSNPTTWINSLVDFEDTNFTRPGKSYVRRRTKYGHDNKGNLRSVKEFDDRAEFILTEYTVNDFGNVIQAKLTSPDSDVKTVINKKQYDSKGRFVVSAEDQKGLKTNYTYHIPSSRLLKEEVENTNLKTEYVFNGFATETEAKTPFGNSKTKLKWYDPANPTSFAFVKETSGSNQPRTETYVDLFGRAGKVKTKNYTGELIVDRTYVGNTSFVKTETVPYMQGDEMITNTYEYDDLWRVRSVSNSLGQTLYDYAPLSGGGEQITTTDPSGKVMVKKTDSRGKVTHATDDGGTLTYDYYADGQVASISMGSTLLSQMEYDPYGHQTKLTDVNAGTSNYVYNVVGQLMSQTDANLNTYTFTYDELGNMLSKQGPEGTTNYQYIYGGARHGLLKEVNTPNNTSEKYSYNDLGLLTTIEERIENNTYASTYAYDQFGNNTELTYPSGFKINKIYDSEGNMTRVVNAQNNQNIWVIGGVNRYNQHTSFSVGNKTNTRQYNKYGIPQRFTTAGIQDLKFTFEDQTGNLLAREDVLKGLKEEFQYDNLDRLTSFEIPALLTKTEMQYADNGNIEFKTDAGAYLYHDTKKNAVQYVIPPTAVSPISQLDQDITYNFYNKVETIEEGDYRAEFTYGHDQQRRKTILYHNGQTQQVKYFSHLSEEINTLGQNAQDPITVEYIAGGSGLAAIHVKQGNTSNVYYTYTDHLGSIVTLTDQNGNIVHEQNFDAWGRRRDAVTWEYITTPITVGEDFWWLRGYTGHEHLEEFALINMNGRLYDPILGRMLSPDNYVQSALFSQSFNRYAYGYNNPLKYTDPDGEWMQLALGGLRGGVMAYIGGRQAGLSGWGLAGYTALGVGFGVASAAVNPASIVGAGFYIKPDVEGGSRGSSIGIEAGYSYGFGKGHITGSAALYFSASHSGTGEGGFYGRIGLAAGVDFRGFGAEIYANQYIGQGISQRTGGVTFGFGKKNGEGYRFANITYENDFMFGIPGADGGDRWRTAALRIDFHPFGGDYEGLNLSAGFNLFTGDPGLNDRPYSPGTGIHKGRNVYDESGEKYRLGALYAGIGSFRLGGDSEGIRHAIQNRGAHDNFITWFNGGKKIPHFQVLDKTPRLYWSTGNYTTTSLWGY
jgi:RHS repeat-associated protein